MRNIPAALQAHMNSGATTLTVLMRVDPVVPGFDPFGITLLDRDVVYDDGSDELVYLAAIGMVPSNTESVPEMGVDNAKVEHLIPEFDAPITDEDITAGALDFAWYTRYLINYEDPSMGHIVLDHGQLGEMRVLQGLTFTSEMTSLTKLLKQSIVEKDSITCRAIFGSQPIGTGGGVVEQRFPCGFDAESLYVAATVSATSVEGNRTFTAGALGAAQDANVPGMVRWLTGANAGRHYEVEAQSSGGVISLVFETMFPIQIGDTFEIRPDCTKWKEGPNGCKTFWGSDWVLHYRGEPYIPIADADAINMPGATVGKSLGGSSTIP